MGKIETQIQELASKGVKEIFNADLKPEEIQIQNTRKEFEGEFTIVTFPLTKLSAKSPEETGNALGQYMVGNSEDLESFSVVKGFLNLKFRSVYWVDRLNKMLTKNRFGFRDKKTKGLVMVEYSSPNTNKPLHLGHLRNIFLGYSVSKILEAYGHTVKRVQIINDRGIHICKSMLAWQKFGEGETPRSTSLKGDHFVGKYYIVFNNKYKEQVAKMVEKGMSQEDAEDQAPLMREAREMLKKWEAKDPQVYKLWETMNEWVYDGFNRTYERMGVRFDKLYYESNTWTVGKKIALEAVDSGVFNKQDDGSVWVDLTNDGLDKKLILRKDGTAVYMTQDIGTAILRYHDFPELTKLVYTVGNEQEYHFQVLFKILEKLGHKWAKDCYHLSYGMVELPEGKMKSREGTVVDADEIMETMVHSAETITTELGKLEDMQRAEKRKLFEDIGMAALKYFLLRVDPKKNMLFDPKESIDFNGHTGPFIQYSYARIQSVLRSYGSIPMYFEKDFEINEHERALQHKIYQYPYIIESAALEYNPALLANYIYDLAKDFAAFYQNHSILQAETENIKEYRAGLAAAVGRVIESGMELIGICVPNRM
ncbi:arginine--tRNA ligase [Cryomorpha ignava]|uniref:Arginine--tRNA ligase n=1 Tax=Cryomorpha ignava TaxID=101383 RepID=A0A7K3WNG9_9FLAO|nr:arginine--tRNA ligase [Cryomorpha ignava]NEN23176.1 arginine--tRNA ligase [Cryomorpha ignava]